MEHSVSTSETGTRSVRRAVEVLRLLGERADGCSLSDVARSTGLSKATVHRLLQTLISEGLVDLAQGRYTIGAEFVRIAAAARQSSRLVALKTFETLAAGPMSTLRDLTGETVALVIRQGDERTNIAVVLGTYELIAAPKTGTKMPIFLGGPGKLLLAFAGERDIDTVAQRSRLTHGGWPAFDHSDAAKAEFARIRDLGYATSFGEAVDGQASIACPVRQGPTVIAALNLITPTVRYTDRKQALFVDYVRDAAAAISGAIAGAFDHNAFVWE